MNLIMCPLCGELGEESNYRVQTIFRNYQHTKTRMRCPHCKDYYRREEIEPGFESPEFPQINGFI